MSIKARLNIISIGVLCSFVLILGFSLQSAYKQRTLIKNIYQIDVKGIETVASISDQLSFSNSTLLKLGTLAIMGEDESVIRKEATESLNTFKSAILSLENIIKTNHIINTKQAEYLNFKNSITQYQSLYLEITEMTSIGDTYSAAEIYPKSQDEFHAIITFLDEFIIKTQSQNTYTSYINFLKISSRNAIILTSISVFTIIAILIMMSIVIKSILKPLGLFTDTVNNVIETGNFSTNISYTTNDEIKPVLEQFNRFMESQKKAISDVNDTMSAIASGDYSKTISTDLKGDLNTMKENINSSIMQMGTAIAAVNEVVKALANGDFKQRVKAPLTGDLKLLKNNINNSLTMLEQSIDAINDVMTSVSNNDLKPRIKINSPGDLQLLSDNINHSLDSLMESLTTIAEQASNVAEAANQTSIAVVEVANSSQNQAISIASIKTNVSESNKSFNELAEHAGNAADHASTSNQMVTSSQNKIKLMVEVVKSISDNSMQINSITDMISDIASQTNLLSLNAAIEAARAGEHGKGFAVVADEVRKLAENSAQSANDISQLVEKAVKETDKGVSAATEVHNDMEVVSESVIAVTNMVDSISGSIASQTITFDSIRNSIESLSQIAEDNNAIAEEITASSEELSAIAQNTMGEVKKFYL